MPGTATGSAATAATVAARTPASVEEVAGRLREIAAALPLADGVAVFNRLYLTVTEAVRDRLADGYFTDPPAVAELDALFAGRYLLAVAADAAGQEPPACWRPLFALRAHPGVHPLQFALAGMNAHIQHDLPLAVVELCRRRDCAPAGVEQDYHRINGVLAEVEAVVREQLLPGSELPGCAEPLTHLLGAWSVEAAREGAWSAVQALWELRGLPTAAQAFATMLDGSVGLLGHALLLPLVPYDDYGDHGDHHGHGDRSAHDRAGRAALAADAEWHEGGAGPGTAAAARLPEARNRTADGTDADGPNRLGEPAGPISPAGAAG
ncbi:DUF5995 family protein [Kitasatospora sp. NPDC059088]|uniref:DUF5995 family protein n=1 Tax=Kitasatospora sp. NPDC059088 TaxID=3346722 RepID=UPI0036871921